MPTQKQYLDNEGLTKLLDELGQYLKSKQDTLVSGTNIKTINSNSLLGSGDVHFDGGNLVYSGNETYELVAGETIDQNLDRIDGLIHDLGTPNEIASITTSESSASGGNNTVTITETNGTSHTFNVKNGVDGQNGVSLGQVAIADNQTTDDATQVLSARQGKLIGDDLSRLKDYEFGVKTYDEDDLFKNKSYTNNTTSASERMVVLANYGCIKIPVTKGDKLTIATSGASGARAYSLCDEDLVIYLVASSNKDTTSNPDTISVTKDGYCHINCKSAAYSNFGVTHYYSLERQMLADNTRSLTQGEMNGTSDWIRDKLETLAWEFNQYVKTNGTTAGQNNYCASPFIPVSGIKGHNITFCYMFNAWSTGAICFYNSSNAFISGVYYTCNANNAITVDIGTGSSWDNAAYLRMTCNPNKLSECYILDNTTGVYIWKGSDYLGTIYENNLVSYAIFRDVLLSQESGEKTNVAMSQKAVGEAIEAAPLRKMKYNNYAVFGSRGHSCYSVDSYSLEELKVISSLWISDSWAGGYSTYHSNLNHILGIVSATSPSTDFFSVYEETYSLRIRFRRNNSYVVDEQIANYYFNTNNIIRIFTRFDFYGKKLHMYGKKSDGSIITIIDGYDFSGFDLSNLQNVKIATTVGTSHSAKMLFNHLQINNYIVDPTTELNTTVIFGDYNAKSSLTFITKPPTPSTFKFTNEGNTSGVSVTLDDPLHKIVTVDRDTVGLVYNVGFYEWNKSPIQSDAYEIYKVKFTNVQSNLLIRGWSESGGSNYILDPATYVYTNIPMDSNTGTILEYPIEEGKTYYMIYALGSGYSTRFNHYYGGHFTMEITEPTTYTLGRQNLCGELYDGQYFCGRIPFKSEIELTPEIKGHFSTTYTLPLLTGMMRLYNGNIQICNGTTWKQINNS